jgi:cell division protein FtsW (lipid II flippase)
MLSILLSILYLILNCVLSIYSIVFYSKLDKNEMTIENYRRNIFFLTCICVSVCICIICTVLYFMYKYTLLVLCLQLCTLCSFFAARDFFSREQCQVEKEWLDPVLCCMIVLMVVYIKQIDQTTTMVLSFESPEH